MKKIAIVCLVLFTSFVWANRYENPYERDALVKRIKPIGEVKVSGQAARVESDAPTAPVVKRPFSGEQVYGKFCVACHGTGIAGAPKRKDGGAWSARKKQGMATLVKHAIGGLNAMPPKGTCMDCSDDEIKAAIKYMLP